MACIVTYYGHMVNPNAPEPWQVYRWAPEIERIAVPSLFIVGAEEFELRRMGITRAFDFRADQRPEEKLATEDAARWTALFLRRVLAP